MFTYKFSKGRSCPVFVCDACGETINVTDPGYKGAMQMWDMRLEDGRKEGSAYKGRIYHAHIGRCWDVIAHRIEAGGGHVGDMNVEHELLNLLHNTGFEAGDDAGSGGLIYKNSVLRVKVAKEKAA